MSTLTMTIHSIHHADRERIKLAPRPVPVFKQILRYSFQMERWENVHQVKTKHCFEYNALDSNTFESNIERQSTSGVNPIWRRH